MAVMDEFKEERNALKNASLKEKLNYFCDYYKWYVIGSVGILLFIGLFVHEIVTQKDTAFYAVMLNSLALYEDDSYDQNFADYAEIDTDKNNVFFDTSLSITEDGLDEASVSSSQKLMVYATASELDVMVTDSDSIQKYAYSENFYDLREILSTEQIAKYEPYFYYVDGELLEQMEAARANFDESFVPVYGDPAKPEEMANPIPVGIYLDNCDTLKENFFFQGEHTVLAVYCTTDNLNTALKYIDFVFEK